MIKNLLPRVAILVSLSLGFIPAFADAATVAVDVDSVNAGVGIGAGAVLFQLSQKDALDAAVSVTSSASVTTNDDLSAYAKGQMQADANLEQVTATEESVTVKHAVPARFLGIIPVSIIATTEVRADGIVEVRYPWYSFLFAASKKEVRAALESRMSGFFAANGSLTAATNGSSAISNGGSASATGTAQSSASANANEKANANINAAFNAAMKARILNAIQEAFAEVSAKAEAEANAKANANTS